MSESMKDYEEQIAGSFKRIAEGDILKGTVIGISDTMVTVDLGVHSEGVVLPHELSNDPNFSMHNDVEVGQAVDAMVLREDDGNGNILLSLRRASEVVAWDKLKALMDGGEVVSIRLSEVVKGGMVAFLEGVRGFIPASQVSTKYVEDLNEWVGKTVEAVVTTVDEEKKKLVLSCKKIALVREKEEKIKKLDNLKKGSIVTGVVESIEPYGCFVDVGDGLTGLVHVSQMAWKRVESPNEVVKQGQEVKVKVLDVDGERIKLSIKAVDGREPTQRERGDGPSEYSSGEEASTGLAALLADIKID